MSLISVTALGVASAGASPTSVVQNGSFESGSYPAPAPVSGYDALSMGTTAIDNWSVTSGSVDWIGSYWTAQDGSKSIDLNGTALGAISQTFTTVIGATYDVSFYLSGNFDNIIYNTGNTQLTKTTTVSASGATAFPYTATYNSSWGHSNMEWTPQLYQFTARSTSTTLTFSGDPSAGAWGPVIDNVTATRVGLGGGNSPSFDPATSVTDAYKNFMIVDTNRSITGTGELTSWSYYASMTGGSVALVVTDPVQAPTPSTASATVLYVSPLSTPTSTGLVTEQLPSSVPVTAGDQVGLYFQGTPVVVPHTYTTSPVVNAGCTTSCSYYTGNGSFGSAPTLGAIDFQNASSRYYSFSVDGITAPDAPTIDTATPSGVGSVSVSWTSPAWDGGSQITGYDVYMATSVGGEVYTTPVTCSSSTSTSCVVSGLNNGTAYYFTVEAVNAVGNSAPSKEVTTTTWDVPGAPTALVSASGVGQLTVSWTAPTSNGGTSITGYDVYMATSPGGEVYNTPVTCSSATSTSCEVSGLNNGTAYYFTVEAVNAVGNSLPSGETSALTWYDFSGFYSPIKFGNSSDSPNVNKAGSTIPIQFSLGGVSNLGIFESGPSVTITCSEDSFGPQLTSTAGNSSLTYDPTTDSYTYPWKTAKSWAGCTGVLTLTFNQPVNSSKGMTESAYFQFH